MSNKSCSEIKDFDVNLEPSNMRRSILDGDKMANSLNGTQKINQTPRAKITCLTEKSSDAGDSIFRRVSGSSESEMLRVEETTN